MINKKTEGGLHYSTNAKPNEPQSKNTKKQKHITDTVNKRQIQILPTPHQITINLLTTTYCKRAKSS